MILYPLFLDDFKWYYSLEDAPYFSFMLALALFIVPFSVVYYIFSKVRMPSFDVFPVYFFNVFVFFIVVLLVVSSIYFFIFYDSSFRHKSRLLDAGIIVSILFLVKPWAKLLILVYLIRVLNGAGLRRMDKFIALSILFSVAISINSSLDIAFIFIIFFMLLWPRVFVKPFLSYNCLTKVLVLVIGLLACLLVLFVGIGNKVGYSTLLDDGGVSYVLGYMGNVAPRISSSLFSSATLIECCFFSSDLSDESIRGITSTFSNRLDLIFYGKYNSSLIDTINRNNYLIVFNHHAERAGASPGILASQIYTPFHPASLFFLPILYVLIIKLVSSKIIHDVSYSFVSMIAIGYLLMSFFEAPLDILYIFTPITIQFVLFFSIFTLFSRRKLFFYKDYYK